MYHMSESYDVICKVKLNMFLLRHMWSLDFVSCLHQVLGHLRGHVTCQNHSGWEQFGHNLNMPQKMLWKLWCQVQKQPSGAVTSSAVSWWASESACRQAVKPEDVRFCKVCKIKDSRYLRLIPNVWAMRQLEVGRFWKQRNCHLGILGLEILKVQSHFGQLAYTAYTVHIVILCTAARVQLKITENDMAWNSLVPWRTMSMKDAS